MVKLLLYGLYRDFLTAMFLFLKREKIPTPRSNLHPFLKNTTSTFIDLRSYRDLKEKLLPSTEITERSQKFADPFWFLISTFEG